MDLCTYESEEHEHGVGAGANSTLCHGDMGRGRLARTYSSREGNMSW